MLPKNEFFLTLIIVCAALNITLNLVFIPVYQAIGSAIIAIGTQGILAAGLAYSCYKNWKLVPQRKSVINLVLMAILLIVVVQMLHQTSIPVFLQLAVVFFFWILFVFGLKLFSVNWIMEWQREN